MSARQADWSSGRSSHALINSDAAAIALAGARHRMGSRAPAWRSSCGGSSLSALYGHTVGSQRALCASPFALSARTPTARRSTCHRGDRLKECLAQLAIARACGARQAPMPVFLTEHDDRVRLQGAVVVRRMSLLLTNVCLASSCVQMLTKPTFSVRHSPTRCLPVALRRSSCLSTSSAVPFSPCAVVE